MNALLRWLDHRTGIADLMHAALYEHVPGGARWRYVWGSTLVFAFASQVITGVFLWMSYAPSSQTAWESVYYIQHEMQAGWLLRGLHHFMAQAMVVLLALHLMQVVIDGAYRAPREVNFWLGLVLMQIVLGAVSDRLLAAVGSEGLLGHDRGHEPGWHRARRGRSNCRRWSWAAGIRALHAHTILCPARRRVARCAGGVSGCARGAVSPAWSACEDAD